MLAEIHGKLPASERSEDLLTRHVFGTIKHSGCEALLRMLSAWFPGRHWVRRDVEAADFHF